MATSGRFLADNLIVSVGTNPIGNATSKSIAFAQQLAEVSDSDSGGFEEFIPSFRSATIEFEGYVDYDNDGVTKEGVDTLADLMLSGTYSVRTFTVTFGTGVTGDTLYSASAILESLDYGGSAGEAVTLSGTFRVTGPITTSLS